MNEEFVCLEHLILGLSLCDKQNHWFSYDFIEDFAVNVDTTHRLLTINYILCYPDFDRIFIISIVSIAKYIVPFSISIRVFEQFSPSYLTCFDVCVCVCVVRMEHTTRSFGCCGTRIYHFVCQLCILWRCNHWIFTLKWNRIRWWRDLLPRWYTEWSRVRTQKIETREHVLSGECENCSIFTNTAHKSFAILMRCKITLRKKTSQIKKHNKRWNKKKEKKTVHDNEVERKWKRKHREKEFYKKLQCR